MAKSKRGKRRGTLVEKSRRKGLGLPRIKGKVGFFSRKPAEES